VRYVPKRTNQKLKLYYLAKIMVNNTGDEHAMTLQDIKNALEQYEITADRKSLYDDFNVLRDMGIDILEKQRGRSYYYHVGKKKFELAELKVLVDAIQSSKFITVKKSHELIRKLESFASRYEASKLQRQVVVTGRIKTMNECIISYCFNWSLTI
jgi:predicted DNA-binding transcriptional regulator YafY